MSAISEMDSFTQRICDKFENLERFGGVDPAVEDNFLRVDKLFK